MTGTIRRVVGWAIVVWLAGLVGSCGGSPPSTSPPEPLIVTIEEITETEQDALDREEARILSDRVSERRAGEHGALPPVEQSGEASPDAWPVVLVKNDTPHGLVVWFSGPCPRTVALLPGAEHIAEFCEGNYEIAAELAADDYLPFVNEGDALDNGYLYGLSFYIVAEPRNRTRRVRGRGTMGMMGR
jgi:hypothetical protein